MMMMHDHPSARVNLVAHVKGSSPWLSYPWQSWRLVRTHDERRVVRLAISSVSVTAKRCLLDVACWWCLSGCQFSVDTPTCLDW
jgi:hypothetical protein